MKRKCVFTVFFLLFFVFAPLICHGYTEARSNAPPAMFMFPESLKSIEDEAFSHTSVNSVMLPDGFVNIGEKAFADDPFLTDVYIPDTTEYIADSAFENDERCTIHGISGSYAQEWALGHQIPFIEDDIWQDSAQRKVTTEVWIDAAGRCTGSEETAKKSELIIHGTDESKRPQDRPELHPIDYRFP